MSFMVSRFDFVASGFAFQHPWLEGLQGVLDSVFCGILGLSGRNARLFLRLPVEYGGAGCPWLTVRADLRYLHQVMRLPFGRSALGALAGEELWDSRTPGRDVEATNLLLSTYGMGLIAEGEENQLIPRIYFRKHRVGFWCRMED